MPNPIGTKEQRKEILRWWPYLSANDVVIALDGLDIAEEREEHMRNHPIIAGATCEGCVRLSRRWQAWERGDAR